ncbi:MAG TPA: Uma2 family endonuclease [Longimicrobium sp.]|nr:Uma2 family endonuclease [Longimicrobium sp.]
MPVPLRSVGGGWTYSEFARLSNDPNRYEVIDGEVFVTPVPSPWHQEVAARLFTEVRLFVEDHHIGKLLPGPLDVLFADGDYLSPDMVMVRLERLGIVSDRGLEGVPDLIVEITSPLTAERDRGIKCERYAYFGVPHYWIVDPHARQIEVHQPWLDPRHPVLITSDVFSWQPYPGSPTLKVDVAGMTAGFDDYPG